MKKDVSQEPTVQAHSEQTVQQIVHACRNAKGKDLKILEVSDVFDLADYFIIVSGRSDRHVQGICNKIALELNDLKQVPHAIEGFEDGHWVLMDCGDVIVHIFYEPVRGHYDIEGLWLRARQIDPEEIPDLPAKREAA